MAEAWSWTEVEGAFFDQHPSNQLQMCRSLQAAKEYVQANRATAIGCTESPNGNFAVVKIGTEKCSTHQEGWTVHIYHKSLPPSDSPGIFSDNFACTENAECDAADWKRPGRGDGLGDEFQSLLLFESISPNDLQQGQLGDCWLISSMATMAEFPDALMSIFETKSISSKGKYVLNLYSWKEKSMKRIVVDDRLPCSGNSLSYTQMSHSGEIWPCILEKAFAAYTQPTKKASGGYKGIDGGFSIFAFGALTGCTDVLMLSKEEDGKWTVTQPQWTEDNVRAAKWGKALGDKSDEEVFQMLEGFDKQEYLMCAGSSSGSDKDISNQGIVQGHAYSLIRVEENVAGSGVDLLQMRNPWGSKEWTGDWSDNSPLWEEHPEIQDALHHEAADDGMFWIDVHDFMENFKSIYVCKKSMGQNRGKTKADAVKMIKEQRLPDVPPRAANRSLELNRQINGSLFSCFGFNFGC